MKRDINSSGIKSLENLIGSFTSGELVLMAGRPETDITQILIKLAINLSKKTPVFYFTPKGAQARLTECIISTLIKIPVDNLTTEHPAIASFLFPKTLNNIHIHDSCRNSMEVLKHLRHQFIKEHKLKFIVIDNLQQLCIPTNEIKFIRELKNIARDFGIVAIVATEISGGEII